jgi:hypothetical protein
VKHPSESRCCHARKIPIHTVHQLPFS